MFYSHTKCTQVVLFQCNAKKKTKKKKNNNTTTTTKNTLHIDSNKTNNCQNFLFVSVRCYLESSIFSFHNQNLVIRSTFVFFEVVEVGGGGGGGGIGVEGN
jgi:hypothetical protein